MNLKSPLNYKDVQFKNIVFTHVSKNTNKNIIYIKYQKNKSKLQNFVIQTPSLWSVNQPRKISDDFYDLEIPLISKTENKTNDFIKFLGNLDKYILDQARTYSSSWFYQESNSATFINTIRENEKYKNGMLKVKILNTLDFKTIIKKNNKEKIKINDIPVKSWFKSILQIYAIWVKPNNEFGLYFRPIIISFKIPENLFVYEFIESEDDEIPDTEIEKNDNSNIFVKRDEIKKLENQDLQVTSILKISESSISSTSSDKQRQINV